MRRKQKLHAFNMLHRRYFFAPNISNFKQIALFLLPAIAEGGAVAQSVEQRTENPCVGGSIPPHTTRKRGFFLKSLSLFIKENTFTFHIRLRTLSA
jgi:hypothetical protein